MPKSPGIYVFSDDKDTILYIGKAKNLKSRVASYFSHQPLSPKTQVLVSKIKTISYLTTATEIDALLLEASQIRRFQPRYNIELKDGKNYPLIKITSGEIPQIRIVRKEEPDGAKYFGPYPESRQILWLLRQLRKIYPYVTQSHRPNSRCFRYHLGLCPCPQGGVEIKSYRKNLNIIAKILAGSPGIPTHQPWEYNLNPNLVSEQVSLKLLSLSKLLNHSVNRIECFDISHTGGTNVVASMVVFTDGQKDSKWYRRFKIRTDQNNDVAAMAEVLSRRFHHPEWPSPDLVVIDGGLPQLNSVLNCHSELVSESRSCFIALAKKLEEIYLSDGSKLNLPNDNPALQLLQEVRDEAHRFAKTYHVLLRSKTMLK